MKTRIDRRRLPFLATFAVLATLAATFGPAPFSASAALAQSDVEIIIFAGNPVTEGEAASFTVAAQTGLGGIPSPFTSALTVNLSVSEASGSDFVAAGDEGSKTVVIPIGSTRATYTVDTVDDSTDEPNGSVTVTVKSGSGYRLGDADSLSDSVRVDDNDGAGTVPPTGPTVQSAWVDGSFLALNLNTALKATSLPSASRFTVAGTASPTSVTAVRFDAFTTKRLLLSISPAVSKGDTGITVSYAQGNDANPLQDAAGNKLADLSSQEVVNTTGVPTVQSATVDGSTLTLTFSEPLYTANGPPTSGAFSVAGTASATAVTAVAFKTGDAASVELTLSPAVSADDSGITVSYAAGNAVYTLQETITSFVSSPPHLGGIPDEVADFTGQQVTNVTGTNQQQPDPNDTTAPTVTRATVDRSRLALVFNESMDTTKVPSASRFTVAGTASATSVTAVSFNSGYNNEVTPARVELTLSTAVAKGDTGITVSYAQGNDANPLQDASGNKLADFSGQAVPNATGVPTVQSATVNGSTLTLTFTEPLYTDNPPPSTGAFTVAGTQSATSVTAVAFKSGDAASVKLTLSPAVTAGDSGITVNYTSGLDPNPLRETSDIINLVDHHGTTPTQVAFVNFVEDFTGQQVKNVTGTSQPPTDGPDTTAPTVTRATVDGSVLALDFSETMDTTKVPSSSRFTVAGTNSATSVTAVRYFNAGQNRAATRRVELTLSPAVAKGDTGVTVSYAQGNDANPLQDAEGNTLASFSGQEVANATGVPTVQSATVNGSRLTLTFSEPMYTANGPPNQARFTMAGTDIPTSVTAVAFKSGDATSVELTLNPPVLHGDAGITVSYAKGSEQYPLQESTHIIHTDSKGKYTVNEVADFTGQEVRNVTGTNQQQPDPNDTTAPAVQGAEVDGATLTLTFDEALKTTGVPSASRFTVIGIDGAISVTAVAFKSGDAASVELTLSPAVAVGATGIALDYAKGDDANPLQDTSGNKVVDFSAQAVENVNAAPTVQTATVRGSTLTLTFNAPLYTSGGVPSTARFSVAGTGSATSVTAVAFKTGDAASVELTLSTAVAEGDTGITVSYTRGSDPNQLLDLHGNFVADFTGQQVTNVTGDPVPGAPAAPSVSAVPLQPDRLSVSWSAPGGTTATDYDLRYYRGSADPANEADWIEPGETGGHDHRGSLTKATITGLLPVTTYRVQMRAVNNGDAGPWSAAGSGRTEALVGAWGSSVLELTGNTEETVGGNTSLAANDVAQGFTADDRSLGYTVTDVDLRFASAPDAGVQVRLATGVSASSGGTTVATLRNPAALAAGVVTFTAPPRTTLAANGTYFVVVEGAAGNLSWTNSNAQDGLLRWQIANSGFTRAASSTGAWTSRSQKASVRINGRPNVGDPPGAPDSPTLTAVSGSTSVTVSWSAPDHTGSGITDYDLRYYEGSADPADEADWVEEGETTGLADVYTLDASTGATITGLQANTAYRVQVRAESHGAPGPWSPSSPVTTNAESGTNNAPTLAKLAAVAANGCVADTGSGARGRYTIAADVLQSVRGITDTSQCVEEPRRTPMFIDPDGDDLTAIVTSQIPDNVRLFDGTPWMDNATDRVWIRAVAAGSPTNVRVDLTAVDPHGASVSAWFDAQVLLFDNTEVPRFDEMVGVRGFPVGVPIGRWVLPPANGGDTASRNSTGQLPYFYAISGLPPGLAFDPMTRAVTGTPTQAGSYTVTYTADDADAAYSLKASPTAADLADVARQSFVVRIGAPAIELVQIVSAPTYDANGDGSFDTYIQGDRILVDVQFTEAVEVTGTPERAGTRPRMRLNLNSAPNNRVLADLLEEGGEVYGGRRLRFGYTVKAADADPDGVWVETAGANGTVVFVPAGLSLVSKESGADVVRTFPGLPTSGAANAKVDGSVTSASIGPRPVSAETDAAGDTVTVTFSRALSTQPDLSGTPLAAYLSVRGAGVVGAGARGQYQHPNRVAVSGSTLVLELNTPANASDTVTLSYENVGGAVWPLKDQSSPPKRVAGWIDLAVTNNSTGVAAPVPTTASAVGTALELVFDQRLDQDSRPPGSAFTVRAENVDRVRRTIAGTDTAVVIDDAKVAVTLAAAVVEGELLSVSYARPADSPLRNAASTAAVASFEAFKVEGVYDSTAPTLLSKLANIQLTPANDDASQGKSSIMLYYDERLDRTSVPAVGDFALSSTDSGAVAGAVVSSVAVEDTAVVVTTSHWLRDNIDYTLAYTPGTAPIEDLAGNAAAAFTETVRSFAVGQPVLRGSTVAGTRLELNMASPLNPAAVPPPSAFTLWETDVVAGETELHEFTGGRIVSVSVNASLAVLQLEYPVYPCAGETVFRVSYTLPSSGDQRFQTAAGWGAEGWTATKWRGTSNDYALVKNARHARCAEWLAGTYIGSVVLKSERAFARDRGDPNPAWFTVSASGGPVAVTGAAFDPNDPKALKLTLSREFAPGEIVTVSYRRPPGAAGLWDTAGNQLRDVANAPVPVPEAEGLAASFHGLPEAHDGSRLFGFEIRFSEEFRGLTLRALKEALQVTGGRLVDAKRTVRGENRSVTVRVRPSGVGDMTLALPATTDCSAADAICASDGRKLSAAVSATVPGPPVPVLSVADASADEGGTLAFRVTLDEAALAPVTVDYATADGSATAGADYAATSGTLTFAAGEIAKTVAVAAHSDAEMEGDETFTLTLSGASGATIGTASATGTVVNVVPPLTASFHGVPSEHDGKRLFAFEVRFSEEFDGLRLTAFKAGALQANNGRVVDAKRTVRGENRSVTVRVRPISFDDIVLTLPATTDCTAETAICTSDGRKLSETVTATVQGPALLSVADAEAQEGAGAAVVFTVTLSRAASGEVKVDYATRDGTATAGEDYTRTRGTLTFAAGELEKTVTVPILDDSEDEGRETFTLKLMNARGAAILDGEATGTIINADAIPRGWLARFGRTVAETHVDAVRERLGADRSPGFSVRFAGQPVQGPGEQAGFRQASGADGTGFLPDPFAEAGSGSSDSAPAGAVLGSRTSTGLADDQAGDLADDLSEEERRAFRALRAFLAGEDEGDPEVQALTGDDILFGTSFAMMRDSGTGFSHGIWARASRAGFSGRDGDTSVDGSVTGVMLGTDWKRKGTLSGLILSRSQGTGTYSGASSGEIDARIAALVPWAGREMGQGLSAWGAAGIGQGDMTVTPEGKDPIGTGIGWRMAAAGAEGMLAPGERLLGASLRWHADALGARTSSDVATGLAATSGTTTRLRIGMTANWHRTLASGATLGPRLEAGLRHDGGDAETGFGLEIGGGIGFRDAAHGLSVTLDGRTLALHEDREFGNWGVSLGLSWDPAPETKRGWSLAARQSLGGASAGGVDALLGPEAFPGLAGSAGEGTWSLEAAYGTRRGNGMVGSSYGHASGTDGVDSLRLGWRIEPDADHAADASVDFWAAPGTGAGHEAGAGLQWRW